jgi:DIM1 family U5 snRNP protein
MGSIFLTHLPSAWHVDQAILSEESRLVVLRFGNDANPECMSMVRHLPFTFLPLPNPTFSANPLTTQDENLFKLSPIVKSFAVIYTVDTTLITDFNAMYELYDPCTVMFFWRNKHIQVDFGTGNNNKINFPISEKQELVDIMEVAYRAASKGKGLAVSPKDYSTKWLY